MLELVSIKDVKLNIGRLVREQRLQHELSQDELAAALNISRLTVQKLEAVMSRSIPCSGAMAGHCKGPGYSRFCQGRHRKGIQPSRVTNGV